MTEISDPIVIVDLARTAVGGFQGELAPLAAPALGAAAIGAALDRAAVAPADVDEVIMGCVLPAGMGQAPARQASFARSRSFPLPVRFRRAHQKGLSPVKVTRCITRRSM